MGNFLRNVSSPSLRTSGKSSRTLVWYWLRAVRSGLLIGSCPFVPVDDVDFGPVRCRRGGEDAGDGDAEIFSAGGRSEVAVEGRGGLGRRSTREADEAGLAAEDRQRVRVRAL